MDSLPTSVAGAAGNLGTSAGKSVIAGRQERRTQTHAAELKAAEDTPEMRAVGRLTALGRLEHATFIRRIGQFFYSAVGCAIPEAEANIWDRYAEEIGSTPIEELVWPRPAISQPALEGARLNSDVKALRDGYIALMVAASTASTAALVRPAYLLVLQSLTPDEVAVLDRFLGEEAVPIVNIHLRRRTNPATDAFPIYEYRDVRRYVLDVDADVELFVDNWIQQGIFSVDFDKQFTDENAYKWADESQALADAVESLRTSPDVVSEGWEVNAHHGVMRRTALGAGFYRVVKKSPDE